jgi:hypothetical protein
MEYITPILSGLAKLCTPEVGTVIGGVLAILTGWKIATKTKDTLTLISAKVGFATVLAALLLIGGTGASGVGIGELVCRYTNTPSAPRDPGLDNKTLLTLAEKSTSNETTNILLDYARNRDGDAKAEDIRILARMTEKLMSQTNSTDQSQKALTAFFEYVKARHTSSNKTDGLRVALFNEIGEEEFPVASVGDTKSQIKPENKDTLLSLPWSFAVIFSGIGSILCGVVCWKRRGGFPSEAVVQANTPAPQVNPKS